MEYSQEKLCSKIFVEHCIFQWRIEYFFLCAFDQLNSSRSAIFEFGECSKIQWFLELFPTSYNKRGERVASLDLVKYTSSRRITSASRKPSANVFLTLETSDNERLYNNSFVVPFGETSRVRCSFDPGLFESLRTSKDDVLVIKCEMYALGRQSEYVVNPYSEHTFWLADDLVKMYEIGFQPNYKLMAKNGYCRVHKEILEARSATLAACMADSNCLDMREFDCSTVDRLVRYLYSGDLEVMLEGELPPIGLYECALKYGVQDLAQAVEPRIIEARTIPTDMMPLVVRFPIPFPREDFQNFVVFDLFGNETRLLLWLTLDAGVCILHGMLGAVRGTPRMFVETSLADKYGYKLWASRKILKLCQSGTRFTVELCESNTFEQHNELNFLCVFVFQKDQFAFQHSMRFSQEGVKAPHARFNKLSEDMVKFLLTGQSGDLVHRRGDKLISSLSYLVSYRIPEIAANILSQLRLNTDKEFEIVQNVMHYVHTGTFAVVTFESLLPIMRLHCRLSPLMHQLCVDLMLSIPVGFRNVFEAYEVAKELRIQALAEKCKRIFRIFADMLMTCPKWTSFKDNNLELSREILQARFKVTETC